MKMNNNELISIIIPIHNAGKYLRLCIESIISQTYTNLEIILVDDASEDNSKDIIEEYVDKDERIKFVKNDTPGGSANARNRGIEIATGRWMTFIDSDDYIDPNMIEKMHTQLINEGASCCVCSFHYVDKYKNDLPWYTPQLSGYKTMSGKETAILFLKSHDIEGFSWNKLFDSSFFIKDGIRFDEEQSNFVDMYAVFSALLKSDKVCFCEDRFYYYYQRQGSLVHSFSIRKLDNFYRTLGKIRNIAYENGIKDEADYYFNSRMISELYDVYYKNDLNKIDKNKVRENYKIRNFLTYNLMKMIIELVIRNERMLAVKYMIMLFSGK